MQSCASCGAENRDVARFCANCGQPLQENDRLPVAPPEPALPPAAPPEEPVQEPVLRAGLDGVLSEEEAGIPAGELLDQPGLAEPPPAGAAGPAGDAGQGDTAPPAAGAEPPKRAVEPGRPPDPPAPADDNLAPPAEPALEEGEVQAGPAGEWPPLPPLPTGETVGGRWQIVALQEPAEGRNAYLALDLAACPRCGGTFDPGEDYCSECGVQLAQAGPPPAVTLYEARSPDALVAYGPAVASVGDRLYVAAATPAPPSVPHPVEPQPLAMTVGYASDRGMVRELDEDSVFVFTLAGMFESRVGPSLGLFIVADGMGGHEGGELASKEAVHKIADTLIDSVLRRIFKGPFKGGADGVKKNIQRAVIDANTAVHQMAVEKGIDAGTTVTLAVVVDGEAHIANVGDSRSFLFRDGQLRQVTQDHSLVASLVAAGVIQPDEVYTHPQRNAVYRSLGTSPKVEVDQFYELLQPGDALVLCCDGVWETIRPEGIEEVLLAVPDPQVACNEMIRRGNAAGGDDNLSVVVVRVA